MEDNVLSHVFSSSTNDPKTPADSGFLVFWRIFFAILAMQVAVGIVNFVVLESMGTGIYLSQNSLDAHKALAIFRAESPWLNALAEALALGAAIGSTGLFVRRVDGTTMAAVGWRLTNAGRELVQGAVIGGGLIVLGFVVLWIGDFLHPQSLSFSTATIVPPLIVFVFVAVNEEFLLRAYVLRNLMDTMKNRYMALGLSACIFAALHLLNPDMKAIAFANLVVAGLLFGIYFVHKRSVWQAVGMHFAWNYTQCVLGFNVSGQGYPSVVQQTATGSELFTGGAFGFEGSVLALVLQSGAVIWIHLRYRTNHETQVNIIPQTKPLH